jgi:hypothetical protein
LPGHCIDCQRSGSLRYTIAWPSTRNVISETSAPTACIFTPKGTLGSVVSPRNTASVMFWAAARHARKSPRKPERCSEGRGEKRVPERNRRAESISS